MGRKKYVCIWLRTGFLFVLLFASAFALKPGSTAFAEASLPCPSVEEVTKPEDDADPSQDSSSDEATQDVSVSDEDSDIESESSAIAGDFSSYSTLDTGTYFLTSALSGHRVLDVAGGSVSVGAAIQLYRRNETAAQQFVLEDLGDAQYAFKNVKSGLFLCYPNDASCFSGHPRLTQRC